MDKIPNATTQAAMAEARLIIANNDKAYSEPGQVTDSPSHAEQRSCCGNCANSTCDVFNVEPPLAAMESVAASKVTLARVVNWLRENVDKCPEIDEFIEGLKCNETLRNAFKQVIIKSVPLHMLAEFGRPLSLRTPEEIKNMTNEQVAEIISGHYGLLAESVSVETKLGTDQGQCNTDAGILASSEDPKKSLHKHLHNLATELGTAMGAVSESNGLIAKPAVRDKYQDFQTIANDINNLQTVQLTGADSTGTEFPPGHFYICMTGDVGHVLGEVKFQNGPVKENGVNGWTNEALLAVIIHRTGILNQHFPASFNDDAIKHMKLALEAFESRTKNRLERGVEGTNTL